MVIDEAAQAVEPATLVPLTSQDCKQVQLLHGLVYLQGVQGGGQEPHGGGMNGWASSPYHAPNALDHEPHASRALHASHAPHAPMRPMRSMRPCRFI